jgi:predicted nucleotidyltransferase
MDQHKTSLRLHQQAFLERFVKACQADDRVVAAFLGGSHAKGYGDAYSDVDVCVITTDPSFEEFFHERETFLRSLGDLIFLEDFGNPNTAFYIFADDTEGELYFGGESRLSGIHSGPYRILIDKKNILDGVVFSEEEPAVSEQVKKLRQHIQWFWHEMSHFITAMQRDKLWWAQGQLEALRSICVNLARLQHNILDADAGEEAYFKIETVMPVEQLSALRETFGPMEKDFILKAGLAVVRFYRQVAPSLAKLHGIPYPGKLERVMMDRLQQLQDKNQDGTLEEN